MDISVYRARCACGQKLLIVLDFYWWLTCEFCGYKEIIEIEEIKMEVKNEE